MCECEPSYLLEILKQVTVNSGQLVTWLLVLSGWTVVSGQQDRRQRRTEFKELIESCVEEIREIQRVAREYWPTDPKSPESTDLAADIRARLKRLGLMTGAVSRSGSVPKKYKEKAKDLITLMTEFRRANTMAPFDDINRKPAVAKVRLQDIETRGSMLWTALEEIHTAACPP